MIAQWTARLTRDKADTLLLLLAALLVLAPHFSHLPLWTTATVCLTLCWRAAITLRGSRLPPLWLLLPVSVLAMGGIYLSFRTLLGRDAGVAMLTLLLTFKLLEMHARRDLFVVTFLCFFLLLTNFFYSQSILMALEMAVTLVVLLAAQLTFQFTGRVPPLAARLKLAGTMFITAAPLALLLYVGFPRIQGPLWGMPGDASSGRSGISDTMSPGSMSKLALSEEVAFRVRFSGPAPAQQLLYWRGPVLSEYDGRTWSRSGRAQSPYGVNRLRQQVQGRGTPIPYEVTLEPGNRQFLFTLEMSGPGAMTEQMRTGFTDELETVMLDGGDKRMRYANRAYTTYVAQPELRQQALERWLSLPPGFNPASARLAQRLRAQRAAEGDAAAIGSVLQLFRNGFEYTLEPTRLGRDAIDEFLFVTRKGFCEHYASAFVYLMRGAGLPARVVTGYQGGELNPVDGFYTVRQSDAHAWAEVWLGRLGWVRIDPTAAVAPERIRSSLAQTLPDQGAFGLQGLAELGRDKDSWLGKMRFGISAMNNAWNQWILDYNPERQQRFLAELGGALADWRLLVALGLGVALVVLVRHDGVGRRRDPLEASFQAFCRNLARHGLQRAPDEGPLSLAQRVRQLALPREKIAAMTAYLDLYGALKYGAPGRRDNAATLAQLKELLKHTR